MRKTIWLLPLLLFAGLVLSCNSGDKPAGITTTSVTTGDFDIKYAKGFKVTVHDGYKLVDISDPSGESDVVYRYALVADAEKQRNIPADYGIIKVPVKSVVCMTSLQLSNFIKLDAQNKVAGITSTRFLFNPQMKEQLKNGNTHKIGIEGEFDNEVVIALNPDIILVSPFKKGGYESLRNLGIPLVSFLGYKETLPLGQAEWLKFTGMLLGEEEKAGQLFNAIEEKYNRLKTLTASTTSKPTVLSGELHSGNWYVVGSESYLAQLFRDAGAMYFMKNDSQSGGFYVDFETVYSQGADAGFWRIVNSFNGNFTYEALKQADSRYEDFKAFKDKKVIYCNLRETPFYENTPVEPEVVLADLIKIFHPGLLPQHTPVYYELLK